MPVTIHRLSHAPRQTHLVELIRLAQLLEANPEISLVDVLPWNYYRLFDNIFHPDEFYAMKMPELIWYSPYEASCGLQAAILVDFVRLFWSYHGTMKEHRPSHVVHASMF